MKLYYLYLGIIIYIMEFNISTLNAEDLRKIQIMNNLAGMNPTGQLILNNGVFKSIGNPAQIVTTSTLQQQSLQSSANNSFNSNSNTPIQISENFENKSNNLINFYNIDNIYFVFFVIIILLLLFLYIILNNKKKLKK